MRQHDQADEPHQRRRQQQQQREPGAWRGEAARGRQPSWLPARKQTARCGSKPNATDLADARGRRNVRSAAARSGSRRASFLAHQHRRVGAVEQQAFDAAGKALRGARQFRRVAREIDDLGPHERLDRVAHGDRAARPRADREPFGRRRARRPRRRPARRARRRGCWRRRSPRRTACAAGSRAPAACRPARSGRRSSPRRGRTAPAPRTGRA